MTSKEKAEQLAIKFAILSNNYTDSKQCALICVDEKMETINKVFNGYHTMPDVWKKEFDELEEVKTEIEKL